jgi:hypothetical protein
MYLNPIGAWFAINPLSEDPCLRVMTFAIENQGYTKQGF